LLLQKITEVDRRAEIAFRDRLGVSISFEHRCKAIDVWSTGTKAQAPQRHPCCEVSLQHRVLLSWPADWPRPSNEKDAFCLFQLWIQRICRGSTPHYLWADQPLNEAANSPLRNLPIRQPSCADNIARARELLGVPKPQGENTVEDSELPINRCPCCGGRMIIIETFARGTTPRHQQTGPIIGVRIDTS
jgi:hypothetical protein